MTEEKNYDDYEHDFTCPECKNKLIGKFGVFKTINVFTCNENGCETTDVIIIRR
jgi:hypothetical protein